MARWDNVFWQSRKTRSNIVRNRTVECRRQQPFKGDLPLCMYKYVPNQGLDVPVTKAASQRQGLPLIHLSGVRALNPSWVWSWVGARSYCHSQTLLLGGSSSQSLARPCATENLLSTGFLCHVSHAAGDQAAELSRKTSSCWDYLKANPPGILLSSWRLQACVKRRLTHGNTH